MRITAPSVESAIEHFKDAAILPARWPDALDEIAKAFRSDGATLVLRSTTQSSIAVSNSIQHLVPQYMSGSIPDPREHRVKASLRDGFMPDYAYFSPQEIDRDRYYQEFLIPNGFGWNAAATLQGELIVSIKRSFRRGPYSDAELRAMNSALPWLRSMSRTACIGWESNFAGQLSAFERFARGAVLLDQRSCVVQVNACVRFGDGIDLVDGRLAAPRPSDQVALNKFLSALVTPLGEPPSSLPAPLKLPRTSGRRFWLLDGIACTDAMRSLHSRGAALVLITDLERSAFPSAGERLRRIFALTPTEAGLASRLAAGCSLQQASRELSISEGHARQRLKTIFQKTGTSRQSELIALLSKVQC